MRKKIAVIVAQVDESTQSNFLTEFLSQMYAFDYDVCIFSMHQKYQETELRNIGDSNIYNLINFELFDGIVMLIDTLLSPGVADATEKRVHECFDGPVIVIDKQSKYFESIMMDHYSPVKKIVDHLIEVHGYKRIAFLGGKEGHPHSVQRLNAFYDSMAEHGLEVVDKWVFHGNYWYESSDAFGEILLRDRDDLPEAIACANDYMAIGLAAILTEAGIRIPEDIAITGYDSVKDGRNSPHPLTSARIPASECGRHAAMRLHSMITGKKMLPFESASEIFIGGSCGCKHEVELVPKQIRSTWRTQQSSSSMFSDFNHMLEDLLAQDNISDFLDTVLTYTYQVKPFYSFDLCLNDGFRKPDSFLGESAIRHGYTDTVYRVLSDGQETGYTTIDTTRCFATGELLPTISEERDYPTAFFFNPVYFDDRCFGYTVVSYGRETRVHSTEFRVWMRDVMQGLEAFYRQEYMFSLIEKIKADQIRDSLTGLYNYEGFFNETRKLLADKPSDNLKLNIIAIDIKSIKQINDIYGRDVGNKAIRTVARNLQAGVSDNEILCRLCNDEFLIALYDDENHKHTNRLIAGIRNELSNYSLIDDSNYTIQINYASLCHESDDIGGLEALINQVISIKNYSKSNSSQKEADEVMDDLKRNHEVMRILDKNLFTYHYQPIVSTVDGSIYAYEALMRTTENSLSPYHIIQSASYLNRLNDIERYTLLNVTDDFEQHSEKFGDSKIFINSLPGVALSEADREEFARRSIRNMNRFVIEFTEESELDDAELDGLKERYLSQGNTIAIDDYGAGYSNANNLLRYMPQYVKIDRMLISKIQNNPQKQHFTRNIIEFAHDNGIVALAEGVETAEELRECIRLGVDLVQGYYTGKPAREPIGKISDDVREEIIKFRRMRSWYTSNTPS